MKFRETDTVPVAAAKAGFSTATAYRIEQDPRPPSKKRTPRDRRRPDPLAGIFDAEIVPMLEAAPGLRPIAIFEEILRRHPELGAGIRRTLERRIRQWRALHGEEQEVIFRQVHEPGRMGLSDFTDMAAPGSPSPAPRWSTGSTISAWRSAASSTPMSCSAARASSPSPRGCRTRSGRSAAHRASTAATASRRRSAISARKSRRTGPGATPRLCAHYGMTASRNNRGLAHENGAIEGPHGHLKRAIEDALLMRGSRDFPDLAAYRRFVDELLGRRNAHNPKRIDTERAALRPLPARRVDDDEETMVTVTSSGGFMLRQVFYTVPSRLIGHRLRVRLLDDRLEVFLGATQLMTLPRGRGYGDRSRAHVVDYRHVIHALRRKPMALPKLVYRDQLFPRDAYRRLYDTAMEALPAKAACRLTVDVLALAHERGCEAELAAAIAERLDAGAIPDMDDLRARFVPDPAVLPDIAVPLAPLNAYDVLTTGAASSEGAPA